jgi:drug/metabolite transporter (DMT)-like permease
MKSVSSIESTRRHAHLLVACLVVVWGCNWPINKVVLNHIPPLWFACLRVGAGGLTFFLVQAFGPNGIKLPERSDWAVVVSIGLLQISAVMGLVQLGLANVSAGRSAILSYTTPLWVLPGSIMFLGERPRLFKLIGLLLGVVGVAVMFNPFSFDWSDHTALIGNLYLMIAAALWAGVIIHVRAHRWTDTPWALAPWQMCVGLGPLVALAWLVEGRPPMLTASLETIVLVIYSGPLITAFPLWALITVSKNLPALTTSLTLLLVPVVGLVSSVLVLSEQVDVSLIVGLLLIVGAVALVNLADAERAGGRSLMVK